MAYDDLHVTPVGDLIAHTTDDNCLCGPRAERITRADGSDGWLHVHHSLDGREQHQPTPRSRP